MLRMGWRAVLPDPMASWSPWAWFLHAFGAAFLIGFVAYFWLFAVLERRASDGDPVAVSRFNRSLRGFPNFVYAKMLGKSPLEADDEP